MTDENKPGQPTLIESEIKKMQLTLEQLIADRKAGSLTATEIALLEVNINTIGIVANMSQQFVTLTGQHAQMAENISQLMKVTTQLAHAVQDIAGVDIQPQVSETHKDTE